MNMNLKDMTLEEIFCAEAGITSEKEYDEYIDKMMQDYEAAVASLPSDEEIDAMYIGYCAAETTRGTAVDYGKYDCVGFDLSDY